jgi:hypothetical protein
MNHLRTSLVDILQPPRNNWLRNLSRRKSALPANVRVVRFSSYEEDETEIAEPTAAIAIRQNRASPTQTANAAAL